MAAGSWAAGASTATSRASTTLSSSPGADPLRRRGDRLLVGAGGRDADDPALAAGARVEQRQRLLAQRRQPPLEPCAGRVGRRRPAIALSVSQVRPPRAAAKLRQHQQRRRKRGPVRGAGAVGGEGEAAGPHRPGAGGQLDRARRRSGRASPPSTRRPGRRTGPDRARRPRARSRARRARSRRGRAAPSRTSGRRPSARRTRSRTDPRSRPRTVTLTRRRCVTARR